MIKEFVAKFMANKSKLEDTFSKKHPGPYSAIVKSVISILSEGVEYCTPDPERILEIDDGHYQGTLVYLIPEKGHQPNDYWFVKIGYGACSACYTLKEIRQMGEGGTPTEEQVKAYMTLALHIVQGLKKLGGDHD